jgi:hypothetical protein
MSYRLTGYPVNCAACERCWQRDDPGVRYDPAARKWLCVHAQSCLLRVIETAARFDELMRQWARQLELAEIPPAEEH